eukprot:gene10735-12495_t
MYFAPTPTDESAKVMIAHCLSQGHIEAPDRLKYAMAAVQEIEQDLKDSAGVQVKTTYVADRLATDNEILLAHSAEFMEAFKRIERGESTESYHFPNCGVDPVVTSCAARAATGSLLEMLERLDDPVAPLKRGFALVRPPGHHCTRTQSGGNGILNNVAIAALSASSSKNMRVLIIDLDIHLSGGTSDCIKDDERILLVDIYGARGQEIRTMARSQGRTWQVKECFDNTIALNVSLIDSAAGDNVYLGDQVLGETVAALKSHQPNVILFSIGFDSCAGDDEGFQLTAHGYGQFIKSVCESSPQTPVIGVLEGGYKPPLVANGVKQVSLAMASSIL